MKPKKYPPHDKKPASCGFYLAKDLYPQYRALLYMACLWFALAKIVSFITS